MDSQSLGDGVQCCFRLQILIVRQGRALSLEDIRNPGVFVGVLPCGEEPTIRQRVRNSKADLTDRDAWTELVVKAGSDGIVVIDSPEVQTVRSLIPGKADVQNDLLLSDLGSIGRGLSTVDDADSDIELSQGNFETETGELLHAFGNVGRSGSSDEVALKSNTVEGHASLDKVLGDGCVCEGLVVDGLVVVVVDT